METGIEFAWVFRTLKKQWWKILLLGIILAGVGFVYVKKAIKPTYDSETALMVEIPAAGKEDSQLTVQQAEVQKIETYKDIISSPSVAREVVYVLTHKHRETIRPERAAVYGTYKNSVTGRVTRYLKEKKQRAKYRVVNAKYRPGEVTKSDVNGAIKISNNANSQVFKVKATTDDPDLSKNIANAVAAVFRERIQQMVKKSQVTIVSKATASRTGKVGNVKKYTLVGLILGVLLGAVIALGLGFYKELTDKRLTNDDFILDKMGVIKLADVVDDSGSLRNQSGR